MLQVGTKGCRIYGENMIKFLIPLTYLFATRQKLFIHRISFILVCVMPSFLLVVCNQQFWMTFNKFTVPIYLGGFICIYCIYEIGYLFNDLITVKFEDTPTLRWKDCEQMTFEQCLPLLVFVRIAYMTVIISTLVFVTDAQSMMRFVMILACLSLSYGLHDYYRNKLNIITMFFLITCRYCAPLTLLISNKVELVENMIFITFLIPFCRTLEYASKNKYKNFLNKFIQNQDLFRMQYYILFLGIIFVMFLFEICNQSMLMLTVYMTLLRVANYFVMKRKSIGEKIANYRNNR